MRHAWILLAAACGATATAPHAPAQDAEVRIAAVERSLAPAVQIRGEDQLFSIADRMREYRIPAVSIAVFDHYEVQWAKAYGVVETGSATPITTETIFLAGSISKSVNALGVLLAASDGTLGLDQPINELLTSWKLPDNDLTRATPVTLRRILSHTAGTTVHGFPGYAAGAPIPTIPQILDGEPPANTAAVRVDLAPGTQFRYSGGGVTISQLALVDRIKRPYPEIMAARVLEPLGMVHSTYEQALPPARLAHAAVGHDRRGNAIAGKRHAYPEMAAAGLWTTPTDLARFFIAVAKARAGMPSKVPHAIAMQMTTKVADADDDAVGLGVFLTDRNGVAYFGHDGSDVGFEACATASFEGGRGLVIMASSDNGFRIFDELVRAVFAAYGWSGADPPVVRVAMEPAQRARFVGTFFAGTKPLAISDDGRKLMMHWPFEPPSELVPVSADQVVERATGARLRLAGADVEIGGPRGRLHAIARLIGGHPLFELEAGRFDDAVAAWREHAKTDPAAARADEELANNLGYQLVEREPAKAIEVLRAIAIAFPDSSNAHDSLGEAYMTTGDKPRAIAEYELALKTLDGDPRIPAGGRAARRTRAEAHLASLRQP